MRLTTLALLTLTTVNVGCTGVADIAKEPGTDAAVATRDSGHDSTVPKAATDAGKDARGDRDAGDAHTGQDASFSCNPKTQYQETFQAAPNEPVTECGDIPDACVTNVTCTCLDRLYGPPCGVCAVQDACAVAPSCGYACSVGANGLVTVIQLQ